MCRHIWRTAGGVRVCPKCGMTVRLLDGKVMHDKELPGILQRKRSGNK